MRYNIYTYDKHKGEQLTAMADTLESAFDIVIDDIAIKLNGNYKHSIKKSDDNSYLVEYGDNEMFIIRGQKVCQ